MGLLDIFLPPYQRMLSEMGFVLDQEGIFARYVRERHGWDIHLERCKQVIMSAVGAREPRTVAILGSGWLLDIPLVQLSQACGHLFLYDIVHPPQIRHMVSRLGNVSLVEADVTGGTILSAYNEARLATREKRPVQLDNIESPGFSLEQPCDLVISLNILNQLDILVCDYLAGLFALDDGQLGPLRIRIQQAHLDALARGNSCLISDCNQREVDMTTGETSTRQLVLTPFPDFANKEFWKWEFDLSGNYINNKVVTFDVIAGW